MVQSFDAIIIGGGVIGCSIAYQLSKSGKKTAVLERGRIGSQASSAAAGMLGVQAELEEDGPMFHLARASRGLYPDIAEELRHLTGIDIALIHNGALKPAFTDGEMERYRRIAEWQTGLGEKAVLLSGHEAREVEPALTKEAIGALYFPDEGQVSPPDLTWAFAKGAEQYGADIREFCEVTDIQYKNGRFEKVKTAAGDVYGNAVVIAAGAWSKRWFAARYGVDIYPVKGEVMAVSTSKPFLKTTIFADGYYVTPKKGGIIYIGATMVPKDFSRTVSMEGLGLLLKKARHFVSEWPDAEVTRLWTGQRPMSNDALPFLGKDSNVEGLYYATGHYRNGILLSPITGLAIAEWIGGQDEHRDLLAPFSVDRLVPAL